MRARHGARVRIIDKLSGIDPHCRAASLHARTLEIFYGLGIVDELLAKGNKVLGTSQYANGVRFMHSSAGELDSPFPFTVTLEQCQTEAVLEHLLRSYDLEVERQALQPFVARAAPAAGPRPGEEAVDAGRCCATTTPAPCSSCCTDRSTPCCCSRAPITRPSRGTAWLIWHSRSRLARAI
jgi:hypothetical protein